MVTKLADPEAALKPGPSFSQGLRFWIRLGLVSFGGTAAHLGIMHEELVERRQWIENEDFLHGLGYSMILPGPEAQQLAIYLGWKLHGLKGGIAAGTLFVLPSMILLLALSILYVQFGNVQWMTAVFSGLRPAALALVLSALIRLAKRSLKQPAQWGVALVAVVAMTWLHVSVPYIMAGAVLVGLALVQWRRVSAGKIASHPERRKPQVKRAARPQAIVALANTFAVGISLWLMPFVALYGFGRDFSFWSGLGLFFTRTAFVTIGGSYTVIPYVARIAVYQYHWLSPPQMLDGFALAETTPGPLIIVVAFVGFMAGFHHFHGSLWMGVLALTLTTFCTFLPCFLFVFGGIPFVQSTRNNQSMRTVLSLIVAVVIAAMADLARLLAAGALFRSAPHNLANFNWVALTLVSLFLILLSVFKKGVGWVIGIAFAFATVRAFLHF